MAGAITIPGLPTATTPLSGSDLIVVEQNGVTKKSTVQAAQQIALTAANNAQTTATAANTAANNAQTTANNANANANTRLLVVSHDTTLTGDGTVASPLSVTATQKKYRGYINIPLGPPPGNVPYVAFGAIGANTVGNIVWTIPSAGTLRGVLANAFPATSFFGMVGNIGSNGPCITSLEWIDNSTIEIYIYNLTGALTTPSFSIFPIDITVNI